MFLASLPAISPAERTEAETRRSSCSAHSACSIRRPSTHGILKIVTPLASQHILAIYNLTARVLAEKLDIILSLKTPKSATVSLHPTLAELYQQKLRTLAEVLQNPKMRDQAIIQTD